MFESDDAENPEPAVWCGEFVGGTPVAYVAGQVEVAEHAQTCGTCGSFRRCCGCGGGWCMELMQPVRDDDAACEEHDPETDGRARG